jgi:serine 3-dehydrogenase
MERLQADTWDAIIDINLNGAFYVANAVLLAMRAARTGHLIFVGSIAGVIADLSGGAYQASKRGLLGLAHAIRLEERQYGIRTCVLCPGLTNTELVARRAEKVAPEVLAKALQPEDVAETILYIASLPKQVTVPEMQILRSAL